MNAPAGCGAPRADTALLGSLRVNTTQPPAPRVCRSPMKPPGDVTPVISGATSVDISPIGGTVYSNASHESASGNKTPFMEALLSTSLDHPNIVSLFSPEGLQSKRASRGGC